MDPYCLVYWEILENIAPAVRVKPKIYSFRIVPLGKSILEVFVLKIVHGCNMTEVGINCEIFKYIYFTVHPTTCNNSDKLNKLRARGIFHRTLPSEYTAQLPMKLMSESLS